MHKNLFLRMDFFLHVRQWDCFMPKRKVKAINLVNECLTYGLAYCGSVTSEIHQLSESLGNAIDAKDHFTRQHSEEVAVVSHILALGMGMPPRLADYIHIAGHLHDIGKIGVPDHILKKDGPLTDLEWSIIKLHPTMGADIIRPVNFLAAGGIVDMVHHHHERYDGRGYPDGLIGDRIPIGSRIITLADSLSAMLQNRPYRSCLPFDEVCLEISKNSGRQFDPLVVDIFEKNRDDIKFTLEKMIFESEATDCSQSQQP